MDCKPLHIYLSKYESKLCTHGGKQLQNLNKFLPSYIFICMCVCLYTYIYKYVHTHTHNIPIHSEDHIYQRKYSFYITLYIYYIYNVIDHMYVHIYLCKNKRLKEWLQLFKRLQNRMLAILEIGESV